MAPPTPKTEKKTIFMVRLKGDGLIGAERELTN
jgi:hypothetical protein